MKRALVVVACVVGAVIAAVGLLAGFGVLHAYRLTGSSMEPTLHCARPGTACLGDHADRVVAVRYALSSPASGDLVAVRVPARASDVCGVSPGAVLIKRIVRIHGSRYFLEGDNRGASCDSRAWGPVSRSALIGRIVATYWPPGRVAIH
jgi:signal peptidase I